MIKTVSIIDDYDRLTMALAISLENKGYATFKFTHPKEALSFHKTTPADFYFIDIKLLYIKRYQEFFYFYD